MKQKIGTQGEGITTHMATGELVHFGLCTELVMAHSTWLACTCKSLSLSWLVCRISLTHAQFWQEATNAPCCWTVWGLMHVKKLGSKMLHDRCLINHSIEARCRTTVEELHECSTAVRNKTVIDSLSTTANIDQFLRNNPGLLA